MRQNGKTVERLTLSEQATIYGCCGLFDMCADQDLMSLHFQGIDRFLDWMGWVLSDVCVVKKEFITWQRPEYVAGSPTDGYLADPCADPAGTEWGKCDFTLEDFGRLRRHGPTRDVTKVDVRYCERQPRYRLDGSPVTDDEEYDARVTTEVLIQDLRRMTITGNATTPGQYNGLENLVKTGYTNSAGQLCKLMDSIVINWNHNAMANSGGATWNGAAIAAGFNFVDVLLDAIRHIIDRIQWSPVLGAQTLDIGDVIFLAPKHIIRCLLDQYTCWSVCEGSQYNEVALQSYEGRQFRQSLNGGLFQAGRIWLDGFEIPMMAWDWGLTKGPLSADAYLLTGQVGNVKTLHGQMNDMRSGAAKHPDKYDYLDGGRMLRWFTDDHTCLQQILEMQPRILSWAPWSNVRFQNIRCQQPGPVVGPDPTAASWFPETSFVPAECP